MPGGDGLTGIEEAIQSAFPKALVQPCVVHMVRNSTKFVFGKDRQELIADLKEIYKFFARLGLVYLLDSPATSVVKSARSSAVISVATAGFLPLTSV
jgi:hypothetical protein